MEYWKIEAIHDEWEWRKTDEPGSLYADYINNRFDVSTEEERSVLFDDRLNYAEFLENWARRIDEMCHDDAARFLSGAFFLTSFDDNPFDYDDWASVLSCGGMDRARAAANYMEDVYGATFDAEDYLEIVKERFSS